MGATPVIPHSQVSQEYVVQEEGYVLMFVSNESPTLVNVYFDDVKMTYTPSSILQYNEYYPFGLQTARSWSRDNVSNNFLVNGGTDLNSISAQYDLEFRNCDPILGRMNQVDPMAGVFSGLTPYNYSFNTPINLNDPRGDYPPNSLASMYGETTIMMFGTVEMHGGKIIDTGTYGGGHIAPGYGNYWADGSRYDDWSPNEGSSKFRQGLEAGLTNLGGVFYTVNADGTTNRAQENNGELGIWVDNVTDWYRNKKDKNTYIGTTYNRTYFKSFVSGADFQVAGRISIINSSDQAVINQMMHAMEYAAANNESVINLANYFTEYSLTKSGRRAAFAKVGFGRQVKGSFNLKGGKRPIRTVISIQLSENFSIMPATPNSNQGQGHDNYDGDSLYGDYYYFNYLYEDAGGRHRNPAMIIKGYYKDSEDSKQFLDFIWADN